MPLPGYYNSNPNLNVSINGINIGEGMQRADMNNALRQMMADIYDWTVAYAITLPLAVASGGTGSTTAATARVALGALGLEYRVLPRANKAAAFTIADAEGSYGILYSGGGDVCTINPEASTAITDGSPYVIRNKGTGALTFTPGGGVSLYKNGATASGSAVLAIGGVATLINWSADDWTIVGPGVS